MPYGNVGTATAVFMDLILQCKLPGRVIKKLDLEFPKARSKRRYGAVGMDYGGDVTKGENEEEEEEEEEIREKSRKRDGRYQEGTDEEDEIPPVGLG